MVEQRVRAAGFDDQYRVLDRQPAPSLQARGIATATYVDGVAVLSENSHDAEQGIQKVEKALE